MDWTRGFWTYLYPANLFLEPLLYVAQDLLPGQWFKTSCIEALTTAESRRTHTTYTRVCNGARGESVLRLKDLKSQGRRRQREGTESTKERDREKGQKARRRQKEKRDSKHEGKGRQTGNKGKRRKGWIAGEKGSIRLRMYTRVSSFPSPTPKFLSLSLSPPHSHLPRGLHTLFIPLHSTFSLIDKVPLHSHSLLFHRSNSSHAHIFHFSPRLFLPPQYHSP